MALSLDERDSTRQLLEKRFVFINLKADLAAQGPVKLDKLALWGLKMGFKIVLAYYIQLHYNYTILLLQEYLC